MLDLAMAHLPAEYWLSYLDDILMISKGTHGTSQEGIIQAHTKAEIRIQP